MQYAERLPSLPTPKNLAAPLAALALGAAAATGAYALIDSDQVDQVVKEPSKVIVLDQPAPAGPGTSAKNEAGVAVAISPSARPSAGTSAKNEAGVATAITPGSASSEGTSAKNEAGSAAAISPSTGPSEGTSAKNEAAAAAAIAALELRGSKASANGSSGSPAAGSQESSDPDDTVKQLHRFPTRVPSP